MTKDMKQRNVNYLEADDDDYEEVYISKAPRPQPYTTNRKKAKDNAKNSESQKELHLRNRTIINPIQIEPDTIMEETLLEPISQPQTNKQKIKFKPQPSIIDQLEPYDIATDILNMKSSATIGQWLQVPTQKKNLAKVLQRKKVPITEANHLEPEEEKKTTAMRCHIRIKGNPVVAILDSGAAVSIITAKLMKRLGLQISGPSKTIVITANGSRSKALGVIENVKITIQDIIIPINLRVIESQEETILLGTDWFNKSRAKLDFENNTLNVRYLGKRATINATHTTNMNMGQIYDEDKDEWIDELDEDDESETYYTEEWPPVADDLYYNPWLDICKTSAFYLADITEEEVYLEEESQINVNNKLTPKQHQKALPLLMDNIDIFTENILEEGQSKVLEQTNVICHEIDTGPNKPIKQRAYTCPPDEQDFIKKEIQAMKENGIIRESYGPWASPIVIVPKKDG